LQSYAVTPPREAPNITHIGHYLGASPVGGRPGIHRTTAPAHNPLGTPGDPAEAMLKSLIGLFRYPNLTGAAGRAAF
jgi:hypothetical protein